MKTHNTGSSLLMVLFFTSALCLMMLGAWRNSLFAQEAAFARGAYAQAFTATQGLLNVAIEISIENYEKFLRNDQETSIEIPECATIQGTSHSGIIFFKGAQDHLIVRAQLKKKDSVLCALQCRFAHEPEGRYRISNWAIENQS